MSDETQQAIVATDLSLRYPGLVTPAVRGVSIAVRFGESVGIVGAAGSGKSTLAAAIAGLADGSEGMPQITGGSLALLGESMRRASKRTRAQVTSAIGYCAQDAGSTLTGILTVADTVAAPIFDRDPKFSASEAGSRVATVIDQVGLPLSMLGRRTFELSNGQRQRVAIARSLVLEPTVLVIDDPIAGIDPSVAHIVLDILGRIGPQLGVASLIVSRTPEQVRRFASRMVVMYDGAIVADGPVDDVLALPTHPYTEALAASDSARTS